MCDVRSIAEVCEYMYFRYLLPGALIHSNDAESERASRKPWPSGPTISGATGQIACSERQLKWDTRRSRVVRKCSKATCDVLSNSRAGFTIYS